MSPWYSTDIVDGGPRFCRQIVSSESYSAHRLYEHSGVSETLDTNGVNL